MAATAAAPSFAIPSFSRFGLLQNQPKRPARARETNGRRPARNKSLTNAVSMTTHMAPGENEFLALDCGRARPLVAQRRVRTLLACSPTA